MLKKLTSIIIFVLCSQAFAASESDFNWSGNLYKKIRKYNTIHKDFFKKTCSPGTEFKYYKLLRNYRGQGNYLPLLGTDIDRQAIKSNLSHIKKKISHIKRLRKKLLKQKRLPKFKLITQDIEKNIHDLLEIKKKYFTEVSDKKRLKLVASSDKKLKLLVKQFDNLMNTVYFLKSYNYPNDHLKNRAEYEKYKDFEDLKRKHKANRVFFYRKIVEDGTYNSKHQRSDLYTRSTLDTLYFKLRKEKQFLSENGRYDLEWVLRNIETFLKEGRRVQLSRLKDWEKRTKESLDFYQDIIKQKNKKKAKKLVTQRNEATIELKKFVYSKQAETYSFWMKQDKLWKSLFALETILYNEVGTIDGNDALERKDVAQIVMNRYLHNFYSTLDENQEIIKYLNPSESKYKKERWLNTLFRVGEFSFTYHYIAAVAKIFCPDMSRRGKKIREKNLKISLKALKSFKKDYKAMRYFSRVSMLGKIDMSSVWTEYKEVPEKPGYEVRKQYPLERLFYADKYQFLYNFKDPKGVSYQVLKIKDKTYSMTWIRGRPRFYKYRSPHLFTYFEKK